MLVFVEKYMKSENKTPLEDESNTAHTDVKSVMMQQLFTTQTG